MEQTKVMDIRDVWRIIRKRRWIILIPAISIFTVVTLIAYILPAIYKSETLILIEDQKIPLEYVQSTVTSQVEERLNVINQRIMSRTKLEEIMRKFNLYAEYNDDWTREEIIEKMRKDIAMEIVSAQGVSKSGQPVTFTVAFKLSYEGKDPRTVQAVTSELASLYIGENLKVRVDASAMTTRFVSDELKKMETEIARIGKDISDFKQQHLDELPEQMQVNIANIDRYERYLETNHRDLEMAKSNLVFLKGQLVMTNADATMISSSGQRVLSPKEQLELDKTQMISMQSKLSDNHPDMIELKKRIARLESEVNSGGEIKTLKESLAGKESELAAIASKYTEKHPDVVRIKAEIEDLKKKIEAVENAPDLEYASNPTNPAYINLQTQIESKRLEIPALEQQEKEYKRLIEYYQQKVANAPVVDKTLASMQSDYDVARTNYQALTNKETQAKISESLENRQQGERFAIIDPAQMPEEPYKPNRIAIIFIGFILGIGAGAGAGFLSEYQDQSFSSLDDLRGFANLPVLAVIPKVVTPHEILTKRKRCKVILVSSLITFVVGMVVVQFFFFKFDIFLIKLFREVHKLPIQ
ncbi:MAG: GNVR domain-containing protein [bacterium]